MSSGSISKESKQLSEDLDIVDLHLDTLIPYRLWGYNPLKRHSRMYFGRHFFFHSDVPRFKEGGLSGGMWSITTNPLRPANNRWQIFLRNLSRLQQLCDQSNDQLFLARNYDEYVAGRKKGSSIVLPAIQGANAISGAPDGAFSIPENLITRMTLIHLTPSVYGNSSSPFHFLNPFKGLKHAGKTLIEQMNERHIFLDLAHAHPKTFWDAVDVHNKQHPLLVTHTGVDGARKHWRNLDDTQIRAVADTGGIVGIMFATNFLQSPDGPSDATMILDHIEYLINIGGERIAAIGSDFDGFISPPKDLCTAAQYPLLIQKMLERGWSVDRIAAVMGRNFLNVLQEYRGNAQQTI